MGKVGCMVGYNSFWNECHFLDNVFLIQMVESRKDANDTLQGISLSSTYQLFSTTYTLSSMGNIRGKWLYQGDNGQFITINFNKRLLTLDA